MENTNATQQALVKMTQFVSNSHLKATSVIV